MFIETQDTPNPNTVKFIPGKPVMETGVAEFTSEDQAKTSRLATQIFALGNITRVFYGADFVSVTKTDDAEWDILKTRIMSAMMDHAMTGLPLFEEGHDPQAGSSQTINEDDDEIVKQIKELIENRVRPMVAQDGGDIVFDRFEEGIVYLQMRGACAGCPSSTMTLKSGIENMLRHYVPEVLEVRQTEDPSALAQHLSY